MSLFFEYKKKRKKILFLNLQEKEIFFIIISIYISIIYIELLFFLTLFYFKLTYINIIVIVILTMYFSKVIKKQFQKSQIY